VPDDAARLEGEARLFARYLVGVVPAEGLIARYAHACRILFPEPGSPRDEALLAFARRHSWSVSFLDAACGLLWRGARMREKVLVMAAVLEASPDFAEEFLPRTVGPLALFVQLAAVGIVAVGRAVAGLLLLPLAMRP
jgi:hypothetical protein